MRLKFTILSTLITFALSGQINVANAGKDYQAKHPDRLHGKNFYQDKHRAKHRYKDRTRHHWRKHGSHNHWRHGSRHYRHRWMHRNGFNFRHDDHYGHGCRYDTKDYRPAKRHYGHKRRHHRYHAYDNYHHRHGDYEHHHRNGGHFHQHSDHTRRYYKDSHYNGRRHDGYITRHDLAEHFRKRSKW